MEAVHECGGNMVGIGVVDDIDHEGLALVHEQDLDLPARRLLHPPSVHAHDCQPEGVSRRLQSVSRCMHGLDGTFRSCWCETRTVW